MTQPKQQRKRRTGPVPNPVDLVVLTRDRLQEVFDDAVARGRMTRDDANSLLAALAERGRGLGEDVVGDIEQLLGRSRDQIERARRATGLGSPFPVHGYDELSVAQVKERLDGLTPAELRKVRDYERRNANRKTVLQAVESKLRAA